MGLDALLTRMEGRGVTSVTADVAPDVTPKPAPMLGCTRVTSVTAENVTHAEAPAAYPGVIAAELVPKQGPIVPPAATTIAPAECGTGLTPKAEARRRRMLAMFEAPPGTRYAALTDTAAEAEAVILALAIRGAGTCELLIPREKWDGVLFLELLERHSATVH